MTEIINRANEWCRLQLIKLRASRGNCCEHCGKKLKMSHGKPNLEFAHICATLLSGMSRGRNRRVMDIKKHPECYKLLCKTCHKYFDTFGKLPITKESQEFQQAKALAAAASQGAQETAA